jgi:twitching motility protein PilT
MQSLLRHVLERHASDLHLSVGDPPIIRIDGELIPLELPPLSSGDLRMLVYSILSVRQRSTYELERELDFSLTIDGGTRFRVNVYWERGNMAAAFRSIESRIPSAEELGLPPALLEMGQAPQGLLLVVGPTGSGKTTTLACLIDRINRAQQCHIVTIEDPIEYTHDNAKAMVHQREVHADTHSFAAALKYILRQDPDVVLIGEMRDQETVGAALTTAETGHLVLATLHTNDAVQTVDRIVDVFAPHQQPQARVQLAASLVGVVSQRLLPRADGKGRVAAFEVMVANAAIRTMIRDNKMHQALSIIQSGGRAGMMTLDTSLGKLVEGGVITREVALKYVRSPKLLPGAPDAQPEAEDVGP